jgi:hypothetical protein
METARKYLKNFSGFKTGNCVPTPRSQETNSGKAFQDAYNIRNQLDPTVFDMVRQRLICCE